MTTGAAPGTLHSAIYVGAVSHRRFDSRKHSFAIRVYMTWLDLDEVERAFAGRWWWSASRPAPVRFRRADYFGPQDQPLADAVRDAVAAATGQRPDGPVRMLTNLRCFGFVFNPVTFYYCFDRQQRLAAVLAEITNTPWGERHHYVVGASPGQPATAPLHAAFAKAFHVSPFQPMDLGYRWTFAPPGEQLTVHMANLRGDEVVFDATLTAERRAWTTGNLWRALLRHPWMTAKVVAMIYLHALVLWCKRAPFHVHPKKRCPVRS
ncbi:MAG: DUF1365 domain-containing protein [Planctomycetota bacterium]